MPHLKNTNAKIPKNSEHWAEMDSSICSKLFVGDILYGNLDDLQADGVSVRRLVVARPAEKKLFLLSTTMSQSDEKPSHVKETFVTTGTDLEKHEIGTKWALLERHIALKAADSTVDGRILHTWLRIWGEQRLHLVARVARAGLHDSLQTISVTRPKGHLFRRASTAEVIRFRTVPKLFVAGGLAEVYGDIERKSGVLIN
jgi:hypothetical protein